MFFTLFEKGRKGSMSVSAVFQDDMSDIVRLNCVHFFEDTFGPTHVLRTIDDLTILGITVGKASFLCKSIFDA
jgi:hypothetical protein